MKTSTILFLVCICATLLPHDIIDSVYCAASFLTASVCSCLERIEESIDNLAAKKDK